ncbi:MAG TPA: CCA tRNA nucleotidyltransferase [Chloroflexota bacterium]|nr:CCA tRNA nucleotidyltransferase [Chloroflexota bacterium]
MISNTLAGVLAAEIRDLPLLTRLGETFSAAGEQLYLVGGCVRDLLMRRAVNDYDLATSAHPDRVVALLGSTHPEALYTVGKRFGTISARYPLGTVEITTFRRDRYLPGDRHPEVEFAPRLEEDLVRRDLTINSMAADLASGDLIDPAGGVGDLRQGIIRVTGDARQRFEEDPLRLLRVVRFAVQLEFEFASGLRQEVLEAAPLLQQISRERIRDELNKILLSPQPGRGVRLMVDLDLARWFCIDLLDLKNINTPDEASTNADGRMRVPAGARMKNLFEHVIQVVDNSPPRLVARLAALFHDIAKPRTFSFNNGEVHFFGHDTVGARMTRRILADLRYDQETIDLVGRLVELHMRQASNTDEWSERAVRRFVHVVGVDTLDPLLTLARADITSSNPRRVQKHLGRLERLVERCDELIAAEGAEQVVSPLDGNELMELAGRGPGRWIQPIKEALLEMVLDGELARDDKAGAWEAARRLLHDSERSADAPGAVSG